MSIAAETEHLDESPEQPAPQQGKKGRKIVGKSPSQIAFARLRRDPLAVGMGLIVLFLVLVGLVGPFITQAIGYGVEENFSFDPRYPGTETFCMIDGSLPCVGPPIMPFTWEHPMGLTPRTGYDNMTYLIHGIRTSFSIAFLATVLSTIIGTVVGLIAGFARGFLDTAISFIIDVFMSFPFILGALALAPIINERYATEASQLKWAEFFSLCAVLVLFGWMPLARLIRGQVLSLREREFVEAAQVMGAPTRRILFKELLPNLVAPIIVTVSLLLPGFVAAEATLSYLGIGITGFPSLGQGIVKAQSYYDSYPLYLFAPVVIVAVLVLALNLLGDSVRDAFDPKTRR